MTQAIEQSDPTKAADPDGWSARELRSLAAVFGTFVAPAYDGESERHAALAAAALNDVAEPSDLRQLRLLLGALESTLGSVALAHGTKPFSQLPRARREKVLLRWSTSPIGRRRTFFQTVKRLACFFAYADPGTDGLNPRWAGIGYSRPDEPVAEPTRLAAAVVRADGAADIKLDAEVVVVGSGAGGGVVAARLAELGHDVLVVESGPFVPEPEMPVDELSAFDRLYLDHGMTSNADLSLAILAGSAVGGGTLVNWTTCLEPPADIRQTWATDHGLSDFDGPSTDGDLARVRDELGFAPPPSIGPKDCVILDGAAALGWEAAPTQRNADGCGDCGACGFGCRRGAKRSTMRLHLSAAAGNGARLLPDAKVERISMNGATAAGVSGVLRDGRGFEVRARVVVVAAGALRTPVLLQKSGLDHPQIGANLHLHPSVVIGARMPGRVDMWRDTTQAARTIEHLPAGLLIESAPGHPGLLALAFPWEGAPAHAHLMREVGRYAPLVGIVRDADGGRVSTTRSGRARIDYRLSDRDAATARFGLAKMAELARAAGAERVLAVATPSVWHDVSTQRESDASWDTFINDIATFDFRPNRGTVFSAHQMGSARAGSDPKASATDPWGRVRADTQGGTVRGLYVADASLFPTAVGVNPMVTVMTMAARVARTIHEDSASN